MTVNLLANYDSSMCMNDSACASFLFFSSFLETNRNLLVTLKFLKTRLQLVNILFYSPVYNRSGLVWIKTAQPAQTYASFGGFDYPVGMGYGGSAPQYSQLNYTPNYPQLASAPSLYPQSNYPQLRATPILYPQSNYPQPYAQPYRIGGYSQSTLQPYPQPVYSPMSNQLQVYTPMINRFPQDYFPY
jgi:hypothetical protein